MKHKDIQMRHEERRITDPALVKAMLDLEDHGVLAVFDEPYPYQVPLNYGYCWDDTLELYLHMASEGYKLDRLRENPRVSFQIHAYQNRYTGKAYRNEKQDYRSVTLFGKAHIVTTQDDPERMLRGMNAICRQGYHPLLKAAPKNSNLCMVYVEVEEWTAKAQYPIGTLDEIPIPSLEK